VDLFSFSIGKIGKISLCFHLFLFVRELFIFKGKYKEKNITKKRRRKMEHIEQAAGAHEKDEPKKSNEEATAQNATKGPE